METCNRMQKLISVLSVVVISGFLMWARAVAAKSDPIVLLRQLSAIDQYCDGVPGFGLIVRVQIPGKAPYYYRARVSGKDHALTASPFSGGNDAINVAITAPAPKEGEPPPIKVTRQPFVTLKETRTEGPGTDQAEEYHFEVVAFENFSSEITSGKSGNKCLTSILAPSATLFIEKIKASADAAVQNHQVKGLQESGPTYEVGKDGEVRAASGKGP